MRWRELDAEPCSVARTISVIGDRWTLMVLRDCFLRVRRFEDFQARLGITRHVLADRLRKLTRLGVLRRVPYQARPRRDEYRLTEKGLDLHPVLVALVHWGDVHMAGRAGRPVLLEHCDCGQLFDPVFACSQCGKPIDPRHVRVHPGPGASDPPRSTMQARRRATR
jgi:DNA-binding HxlR family transcriptional regulator